MVEYAILAVVLSVAIGEFIKIIVQAANNEPIQPFKLGGMPSTHAAAVAALFLSVYYETGVNLMLLFCAVFGWIVVRDAYGVRWEVSKHSIALNKMLKSKEYKRTGHTALQVYAGVALGILVTLMIYTL